MNLTRVNTSRSCPMSVMKMTEVNVGVCTLSLTKKDPIVVSFRTDPGSAHFNAIGDHRYHHEHHREIKLPNSGPPVDVSTCVDQCTADGILEGSIHAFTVNDTVSSTLKKSRQKAWQLRLVHAGQDGQMHLAVQPSDRGWMMCSGEVEY